jgi:hypothetical protein
MFQTSTWVVLLVSFSLHQHIGADPALSIGGGGGDTGQCTGCAMGYFMQQNGTGGSLTCAPCYPGWYSADNSSLTCEKCQIGHFQRYYGRGYCEPCAAGFYETETASDRCTPCGVGQFQKTRGQTGCGLCEAGTFAFVYGSSNCTACPLGSYSTMGARSCRRCPAGSFGVLDNNHRGRCEPCPYNNVTGMIQGSDVVGAKSEAEADCRPLDAIVIPCDTLAEKCEHEQYLSGCSQDSKGVCKNCSEVCPSLTVSYHCGGRNPGCCSLPSKGICTAPEDGFMDINIVLVKNFTFEEWLRLKSWCEPGTYAVVNGTNSTCVACPLDTFVETAGTKTLAGCTPCLVGTTSRTTGAVACFDRPLVVCEWMQVQSEKWSPCVWCLPYQIPSEDGSTCEDLNRSLLYSKPVGPCTEHQVTSSLYNDSSSTYYVTCVNCPPVNETEPTVLQYAGLDALVARMQCSTGCRHGTYTLYATVGETSGDNYTCPSCRPGTFSPDFGGLECLPCKPGSYTDVPESMHCTLSPAGSVQPFYNQSSYTKCNAGSISAAGATVCTRCPPGSHQSESMNRTTCELCPKDSYNNINGSRTCTSCAQGSSTPTTGATFCDPCPAGKFLSQGITCKSCPNGTFSDTHSATTCTLCPDLKVGTQVGLTECIEECPDGKYPMATKRGCRDCPMGTYGTAGVCHDCEAGTYQDTYGAALTCKECDHGNANLYQPNQGQTSCNNCTNGNATNSTSCIPCIPGTHFDFLKLPCRCTTCTPGHVQSLYGQHECVLCETERTGLVAFRPGLRECHRCPIGEQPYNNFPW